MLWQVRVIPTHRIGVQSRPLARVSMQLHGFIVVLDARNLALISWAPNPYVYPLIRCVHADGSLNISHAPVDLENSSLDPVAQEGNVLSDAPEHLLREIGVVLLGASLVGSLVSVEVAELAGS